jgi:acyl carrier protein
MNSNEIIEKLQGIVKPFVKEGLLISIDDELVKDLGFDSIDIVDLVVHIEDTFSIQFTDNQLDNFRKVRDIVSLIEIHSNDRNN